MPRCETPSTRRSGAWPARGRAAACSPPAASSSSSSQYLDPIGRPRPPATGSRIRASSTSPSAPAAGATTAALPPGARSWGARQNRRPAHLPGGGVVYVNDPDGFSVELLWMSPASERHWGFTPRPAAEAAEGGHARGRADGADCRAGADHVGCDRRRTRTWPSWLGLGSVRRTVDGAPDPDGRGSERLLKLLGASVTEQVLAYDPPTTYRYRVTKGSPFVCHQGEIRLREEGDHTELTWRIRFRPKLPGTGRPLATLLSWLLGRVLRTGLKPYVEALPNGRPDVGRTPSEAVRARG